MGEHDWISIPLPVDENLDGYRLDRFIHARIPRLSRTRIQQIIALGHVRRASGPIGRASTRVRAGEVVTLMRPTPIERPVPLRYEVLYEDAELLVVDKPAGLPVHPSACYHLHTLTAVMRGRLGAAHGWEMAHRLDRETSGVMVFGRRGSSSAVIKRSFAARTVAKHYLALVHGTVNAEHHIDAPLARDDTSEVRVKMGVVPTARGGATASTHVVPVREGTFRGGPITLVSLRPRTGRQHQLRVHLAHIGHAIVGDKLYGLDEQWFIDVVEDRRPMAELDAFLGLSRQALHAESLTLPHPGTSQPVSFRAPWPPELVEILDVPASDQ